MATFSSSAELVSFAAALQGQYEIEREIGRGGMGVVYLARDLRLDRMVAIKTLPHALAGDETIRERFLREARTAARLNHPNIVPIHRADEMSGQVFFVMGFIDGDSLAGKLAGGPMSPRDSVPVLRDVAAALGYAHRHGVIHRDIKTENILLDSVTGRAMVTDFGIARVAAAAPLTATGQVLGTVYYLSPEQVADENVDARSDIYALGVVGFAMLSGRFPFDGALASAVLISHVIKPAPPLASVAPHVPTSLAAIIDRCLTKDPDGRFQSCAELDAALDRARADADAVAIVPGKLPSPLLSNTEAQQVLKRAAELNDRTGSQPIPFSPAKPRDRAADARREEGFKTSVLRDAAAEAGIEPRFVEHALAEHGLRAAPGSSVAKPDRRAVNIPFELTRRRSRLVGEPSEIVYEMVVNGEVLEEDYDLMLSALSHLTDREGMSGGAASVGKTLTWRGRTPQNRELNVAVVPRGGRTTIRVAAMIQRPLRAIYGACMGVGSLGIGGAIIGSSGGDAGGFAAWGMVTLLSFLVARTSGDEYSKKVQTRSRELLEGLAAQAREIGRLEK
ncbi:MAG TPA: serine/threonine-protein kinase [Gemmatimonadaceae bacterium]|nr:serine/threonine-protein kinase [Gemmatimonadaceae bacterium]